MQLRTHARFPTTAYAIIVIFGILACNTDEGGEPPIPDPGAPDDIAESDVCDDDETCPGDDAGTEVEPEDVLEDIVEVVEPPPDPTGHENPNCGTKNLSSLLEIGEADDDDFYKVAAKATPGSLDDCSTGCTPAKDCPGQSCSDECCDLCWATLNLREVVDGEAAVVGPEVRTTLNNVENWKCAPDGCTENAACAPLDIGARYVVWGQVVAKKGGKPATLWVDDYCIETSPNSIEGTYEGDFSYDLLTLDENGEYEGKKGSQAVRITLTEANDAVTAKVEEVGERGQVYLTGTTAANVILSLDEGTVTVDLEWCLSEAADCGDTKATLHAKRNTLIGDLNAVGFESALGELKSLTLSVDRVYPKP